MQYSISLSQTLITSSVTLFCGIVLFIISQFTLKLFIEPVTEFRKLISRVVYDLVYHGNLLANPLNVMNEGYKEDFKKRYDDAQLKLRDLAGAIMAGTRIVPLYGLATCLGLIPSKNAVAYASMSLTYLSNSLWVTEESKIIEQGARNEKCQDEIFIALKIKLF